MREHRINELIKNANWYYEREKINRSIGATDLADYWQKNKMVFLLAVECMGGEWSYTSNDRITIEFKEE